MKTLIFTTLALMGAFSVALAQPEVLGLSTGEVSCEIDLAAGQLTKILVGGNLGDIQDMQLSQKNGELVLDLKLRKTDDPENYYLLKDLKLVLDGNPVVLLPEQIKGWTDQMQGGEGYQLVFSSLLDRFINLQGKLSVIASIERWGEFKLPGIDCSDPPPAFTGKQRASYYIAAGVGAAAIGMGQYFRVKSEDVYDNQYLTAPSQDVATPIYEDANGKHHTYLILTYAGSVILAADVIWYFVRDSRVRRRLGLYNEYCNKTSLFIEPVIDAPSFEKPNGQAGFRMTVNF